MFPRRLIYFTLFIFAISSVVASCVNDLESIKKVTFNPNDPDERTTELYLEQTDSGITKMRIYAKLAEMYPKPKNVVQFNEGIKVEFYNENGVLSSILTALYGEINEVEGTMMVRDSVQLFNPIRDQRMETEALYWNKKDSTIYTNHQVSVRTPTSILFGKGIKTRQDFTWYEFTKPQGKIDIKDNTK